MNLSLELYSFGALERSPEFGRTSVVSKRLAVPQANLIWLIKFEETFQRSRRLESFESNGLVNVY